MPIATKDDLQAALLVGGDVICDTGTTIDLTGGVAVDRPVRVVGGSFTCASGPGFLISSSDVEVAGSRFTGAGVSGTVDMTQKLIYALGTKEVPLERVSIHDCVMNGSLANNIWAEWCVDSKVVGNIIEHYLYSGVMVVSGDNVLVNSNVITDAPLSPGVSNVYGVAATDMTNVVEDRSKNITISGNTVKFVDWEGIDTHGGQDLTITGNTVVGCSRGIALVVGNSSRLAVPMNITVCGNTVDATGQRQTAREGICLFGASGLPASATITGNTILGTSTPLSVNFWERAKSFIGNNNVPLVPWTAIPLSAGSGYTANLSFPPQYMVDGKQVFTRGGVIAPHGGIAGTDNQTVGVLTNSAAWPIARTFYAAVKGANIAAGIGQLNIGTDGTLRIDYGNTTDQFTYWLGGAYQAA
jgi:hypothetical protein